MKHTYRVGVSIPVLNLVGDYDVDARILVVPIKGVGNFRANASKCALLLLNNMQLYIQISADCEGQGILKAEIVTDKDGIRRFKFNSFNLALKIGDYNVQLDNLFNGDPVLSTSFILLKEKKVYFSLFSFCRSSS